MSEPRGSEDTALRMSRRFRAGRERVFRAWTDAKELEQWWGPPPFVVVAVEVDLRVGGRYRLGIQKPESAPLFVSGHYKEIRPPERLVFTWRWEGESHGALPDTLVTVEFIDCVGETEVRLTHELFPTVEDREEHRWGWSGCFDKLPGVL